jgi:hypothetical protein
MVHPAGYFQGFHPERAAISHMAMDVPKPGISNCQLKRHRYLR